MDTSEKIWHLIARTLNGEATIPEQQELMEMLRRDESLHQQYDLLARIWAEKQGSFRDEDRDAARNTISRIINKAEFGSDLVEIIPVRSRLRRRRTWMAAASVLVILLSGWLWINRQPGEVKEKKQEIIEAQKGSRSRSMLPDGSTVWLNAGSKIYYADADFSGATREIRLEGEAFFDIVKQPEHPFIVHTSGIDIKVLGTAFNVKSYPEDKTVETTLYRGSVKVFRHEESEKKAIQLIPNEKLILAKKAAIDPPGLSKEKDIKPSPAKEIPASFTIAHIDSTKKENERFETAWLYSRLEFRGDSFEELARKLERWYNVTIVFTDEKVKDLSFNGLFEKETVEQAFKYLKEANNTFNYKISNHEISVGSAQ
ncbi:MAG: FecR domain-containing protein [Bacteroidota bacterium]|nr:FecR domain-containing protein [Bacteroidota bacterium]